MKEYNADQANNTIAATDKQWTTINAVINQFKLDFAALDPVREHHKYLLELTRHSPGEYL